MKGFTSFGGCECVSLLVCAGMVVIGVGSYGLTILQRLLIDQVVEVKCLPS